MQLEKKNVKTNIFRTKPYRPYFVYRPSKINRQTDIIALSIIITSTVKHFNLIKNNNSKQSK